ncbi:MAG TPA: hypothetical protein VGN63_23935 [Flavisolibacter sp.]|jgi:hypothetical protein|nr:hypothetical protein [Flavisolibacter sp.]
MKTINQYTAACLFLFCFVLMGNAYAQAQTASKQAFEKAIISELCDTFTKAAPGITKENMTAELGMMLIPLFTKYQSQIESEWGLFVSETKDIHTIGERIGQLATMNCQAFQNFIKANLQDIVNEKAESGTKTFSGTLTKMEGSPFTYLLVKNAQGKTDRFYWMEFFPGAEKLSASGIASLNKSLRVTYREVEVYKAAEKDYTTIKVIIQVEFK